MTQHTQSYTPVLLHVCIISLECPCVSSNDQTDRFASNLVWMCCYNNDKSYTIPSKISTATGAPEQRALLGVSLLFTRHLHTVYNKATGVFCNIFPLLVRDSALTQFNKFTLYKLLIPSILTYTTPIWSPTCSSSYLRLQVIKSKDFRDIGNHPRRTPHFPTAVHSKHSAHPRYHPPAYNQIFCSLPLTPQPPGPTNRDLRSSRLDQHVPEI
jgi:hypothetical protein